MSENIAQTVQKAIRDLVAPDLRELKFVVVALQKQIDQRFEAQSNEMNQRFDAQSNEINHRFEGQGSEINHRFQAQSNEMNQRFEAQSKQSETQFEALMAAFREFKAQSELASIRVIASLSERVAVLESRHQ